MFNMFFLALTIQSNSKPDLLYNRHEDPHNV